MGHAAPLEKKRRNFFSTFLRAFHCFVGGLFSSGRRRCRSEAGKFPAGIKIGLFSVAARMAKGNTRRRRLVWAFQHVVESGSFFHLSGEVRGDGKGPVWLKGQSVGVWRKRRGGGGMKKL